MVAPTANLIKQSGPFILKRDPVHYPPAACVPREPESLVTDPSFADVLDAAELPPGQMRCVDVSGVPALLVHAKDGIYAVNNICSHGYARLDEGRLRGHRLICPLHGAGFDVRTGAAIGAPAKTPLPSYPVRIVNGRIEVQIPTGDSR